MSGASLRVAGRAAPLPAGAVDNPGSSPACLTRPGCFSPPVWATLSAAQASVDGERVGGHHRALVGGEIQDGVRDLLRGRMAPERDELIEDLGGLVARLARRAYLDVVLECGRGRPRMQRVDPDPA